MRKSFSAGILSLVTFIVAMGNVYADQAGGVIKGNVIRLDKNGFMDFSQPMPIEGTLMFHEQEYDPKTNSLGNLVKLQSGMTKEQVVEECKKSNVTVKKVADDEWRIGTGTILFRDGKLYAGTLK
ncbi:hypothetical protein GMLC_23560 [Geomonas limicola]|uniref:Lipoprotein n=1 Tax=Geomonas limicola TaxID=2740186 RepID=A0A6V8NAD6_9BACT|nr:hypothetical protein [Geomonas limicola]GFO68777.1 hypothetical protein GMLC_23560 [Geomonas limicola]